MSAPQALVVDPERSFLENLPVIDRVIAIIARRNSLRQTDAEEFASWVRARIIEADYAVLRKFAGRSTLPTYLSIVIANLFRDYRNSNWGRWRPSAAATRIGPVGIRLEELLYRDGRPLREAIEVLHSAGVTLSSSELSRLAATLPQREAASEVGLDNPEAAAATVAPSPELPEGLDPEAIAALRAALEQLPPEEQVIMRMRFWDDISVADIARTLRVDQKPLYRRIESIQSRMRSTLAARGIDHRRANELLTGEGFVW